MAIIKRNLYTHVLNYIIYIHTHSHTLNLEIHHIHSHTHTHTHTHTHALTCFVHVVGIETDHAKLKSNVINSLASSEYDREAFYRMGYNIHALTWYITIELYQ